jgi:hypothetical protein
MRFTNVAGLPASWTMGFRRDGREMLVIITKATYVLPASGSEARLADEHRPLVEADRFSGEPGMSAPLYETDYAHQKPACDVLLVGSAYAPAGRRATRTVVGLRVGPLAKEFAVVGPRVWKRGLVGAVPSDPQPFESLRITYDTAFGGTDRTHADKGQTATFLPNPVGVGYWKYADGIDGQPMPVTEQIDRPVVKYDGQYAPMAFSPIGRNWVPRSAYAGTYNQEWIENRAPLWPDDFDERYFQAAPPDQTIPYPRGGEDVVLRNLTPDGMRAFRLPSRQMPVTFIPYRGRDVTRDAALDTIVLEPDRERFMLTWRVTLPLGRSVFDVKETIVGELSPAWHRARRSPGKTYYPRLGDAVAALRRRRSGS